MTNGSRMSQVPGRRALALGLMAALLVMAAPGRARAGDAKQDKINTYIDMINKWSRYVQSTRASYTAWADPERGPTCQERGLRPPGSIGTSAPKTFADYQKAFKKKPALPVDAAANRMAAALTALIAPTNEASDYYSKRTFKDDDCKRGQELHALLMDGWRTFLEAEVELRAYVVTYNDELEVKSLATTRKKYGEKFRYHLEKQLAESKALLRELDAQLDSATPDLAAVRGRLDTLGATLDAMTAMIAKVRDDKKIYGDLYQGGYVRFHAAGVDFRTEVRKLLELVEKPLPKNRGDVVGQGRARVLTSYNGMIDRINKVRFSSRIK